MPLVSQTAYVSLKDPQREVDIVRVHRKSILLSPKLVVPRFSREEDHSSFDMPCAVSVGVGGVYALTVCFGLQPARSRRVVNLQHLNLGNIEKKVDNQQNAREL